MSEESVHEVETQATHDNQAQVSHDSEAQASRDSEATGKNLDKALEQTDETDETTQENNETALDDINIAINGETDDVPSGDYLLEDLQSALSKSESTQQLIQQEDAKVCDNETGSNVEEDVENERTREVKPSESDKGQKEANSSDDTEESDFVDAQAINGIEMLPSSDINADDSDASSKIDSSVERASKETVNQNGDETTLICNDAVKSSSADSTESSNEENSEETEHQFITDREGSQEDLLSSPPDAATDSSSYETPRSSEASSSATSENQSKVVTIQPSVNGVSCRNSVTDGAPIPPARKNKKKGLSSASLGGCFPMACAGNISPALPLSRNDSVYGGSVRSRLVADVRNRWEKNYVLIIVKVEAWWPCGRAVLVRALAMDIVLCSWARHFALTVPLSTQVYKWVPVNLMLGVTLRWTNFPSRGRGGE